MGDDVIDGLGVFYMGQISDCLGSHLDWGGVGAVIQGLSTLGVRLRCLTAILSLSHWYPWSAMVLDCIDP